MKVCQQTRHTAYHYKINRTNRISNIQDFCSLMYRHIAAFYTFQIQENTNYVVSLYHSNRFFLTAKLFNFNFHLLEVVPR